MGLDTCVAGEGRVVFSPSPPLALRLFKPIGCCQRVIGCEGSSSCTNALHSGETRREGGRKQSQRERKQSLYTVFSLLCTPYRHSSFISCLGLFNCVPEELCVQQLAFGPKGIWETTGNCGQSFKDERRNQEKRTKGELSNG